MGNQQTAKPKHKQTELPPEYAATGGVFTLGDEIEPTLTRDEFFTALRRVVRPVLLKQSEEKAKSDNKPRENESATNE